MRLIVYVLLWTFFCWAIWPLDILHYAMACTGALGIGIWMMTA